MQTPEGSLLGVPPPTQAEGLSPFGSERLPLELGAARKPCFVSRFPLYQPINGVLAAVSRQEMSPQGGQAFAPLRGLCPDQHSPQAGRCFNF